MTIFLNSLLDIVKFIFIFCIPLGVTMFFAQFTVWCVTQGIKRRKNHQIQRKKKLYRAIDDKQKRAYLNSVSAECRKRTKNGQRVVVKGVLAKEYYSVEVESSKGKGVNNIQTSTLCDR